MLEPWANEYPIAPGQKYIVEGDGPIEAAEFYVIHEGEYLVVWAWDGSDARVLGEDGTVVADWTELRVPNFGALDRDRAEIAKRPSSER